MKSLVEKIEVHLDEINKEIKPRLIELETIHEKNSKRFDSIKEEVSSLKESISISSELQNELDDIKRRVQELEKFKPILENGKKIIIFCGHIGNDVNFRVRDLDEDKPVTLPFKLISGLITGGPIDLDEEEKAFKTDDAKDIIVAIQSEGEDRIHGFSKFREMVLKHEGSEPKEKEKETKNEKGVDYSGLNLNPIQSEILDIIINNNGMIDIKKLKEKIGISEKELKRNLNEIQNLEAIILDGEVVKISPNFDSSPT